MLDCVPGLEPLSSFSHKEESEKELPWKAKEHGECLYLFPRLTPAP